MNKTKLYVGNLEYSLTSKELIELFSQYGHVLEAMVIPSKSPGKSKGYGFISFEEEGQATEAINNLNGKEVKGRSIVVKLADEK